MKTPWAIVLAWFMCGPALASPDEIRAFIIDYDRAYSARDIDAMDAKLSADYRVTVDGRSMDRVAALADLKAQSGPGSVKSSVEHIHVEGALAAASGTIEWSYRDESGREHYLLVLRREQGQWRALMEHVSAAPDAEVSK